MSLGIVLVTGGCGFIGFHIVQELVRESCSVHVISRNPTINCLPEVTYHTGDLTSLETTQSLLSKIQPTVIFHVASALSSSTAAESFFFEVNVCGTENLLKCAQSTSSVRALVYTSSVAVMAACSGSTFVDLTEDAPLLSSSSKADFYVKTKAIADAIILNANGPTLRTVSIRLAGVYGERDNDFFPIVLRILRQGRQRYQLGDNLGLFDAASASNAATAHILAAKALLAGFSDLAAPKVDGEAFFISDGRPEYFWTLLRQIWTVAGHDTLADQVIIIPNWILFPFVGAVEWAYWLCTFGRKRPMTLRRTTMEWTCLTRTFSIAKARNLLAYSPKNDRAETIVKAVKYECRKTNMK